MSLADELRAQPSTCRLWIEFRGDDIDVAIPGIMSPPPQGCVRLRSSILTHHGYLTWSIQADQRAKFELLAAEAWKVAATELPAGLCILQTHCPVEVYKWLLLLTDAVIDRRIPAMRELTGPPEVQLAAWMVADAYRASATLLDQHRPQQPQDTTSQLGVPNRTPKLIPTEFRTRPMSYREAGSLMYGTDLKVERKNAGELLSKAVKDGIVSAEQHTPRKHVFDVRDFPGAVQAELR